MNFWVKRNETKKAVTLNGREAGIHLQLRLIMNNTLTVYDVHNQMTFKVIPVK